VDDFSVPTDARLEKLVEDLAHRLASRGWKLATAESCTGGWIAKCCTDLAGSSAWFERGFVTYSNVAKMDSLGVNAGVLQEAGAVSREVALQMADGARRSAGVDIAVAVTGVAGPDGGTPDKPVGTVWFGWSRKGQAPDAELACFQGDRDAVRRQSVAYAVQGVIDRLLS
jgi:nicotinamide-nucleotide amidase